VIYVYLVLLALAAFGFYASTSPAGKAKVRDLLISAVGEVLGIANPALDGAKDLLAPIASKFAAAFKTTGEPIAISLAGDFQALARKLLEAQQSVLASAGESTAANAIDAAALSFTTAFGAGLSSAAVAALFEAVFPEKLSTLDGVAPMIAKMAGFDEVAAEVLGPLYKNAFGRSLEYHYRSIFKPELPDEGDAVTWHSRRKLTDDQLRKIFSFSGLKSEYETPYIESAYRALQPRLFATLFQDVEFPTQAVKDAMEFAGIRDQEIALMLPALEKSSMKNVRGQYLSAVTRAAELGTLTDAELDAALTELEFSDLAAHWVRKTITTRKVEQLTELYRKSVSAAYEFGTVTDADYVAELEAIGIAAADAQAHYAIDSTRKHGKDARAIAAAAARDQKFVDRTAWAAARAEFHGGALDTIALAARFALAEMPAAAIPFAVELETLRVKSNKHYVFGAFVTPAQAVTLRERVAVIQENRVKDFIDNQTALDELRALDVPETNAESLVARWQAQSEPRAKPA
jgi:hypothetical protein